MKAKFSSNNLLLKEFARITRELERRKWDTPWWRMRDGYLKSNDGEEWEAAMRNDGTEEKEPRRMEEQMRGVASQCWRGRREYSKQQLKQGCGEGRKEKEGKVKREHNKTGRLVG